MQLFALSDVLKIILNITFTRSEILRTVFYAELNNNFINHHALLLLVSKFVMTLELIYTVETTKLDLSSCATTAGFLEHVVRFRF